MDYQLLKGDFAAVNYLPNGKGMPPTLKCYCRPIFTVMAPHSWLWNHGT